MKRVPVADCPKHSLVRWQGLWGVLQQRTPDGRRRAFYPWDAPPMWLLPDDVVDVENVRPKPRSPFRA